jgi:hypothetical protein
LNALSPFSFIRSSIIWIFSYSEVLLKPLNSRKPQPFTHKLSTILDHLKLGSNFANYFVAYRLQLLSMIRFFVSMVASVLTCLPFSKSTKFFDLSTLLKTVCRINLSLVILSMIKKRNQIKILEKNKWKIFSKEQVSKWFAGQNLSLNSAMNSYSTDK